MEFHSMNSREQLQIATRECPVDLPSPPNDQKWIDFYLSLYSQVINSEEDQRRMYKHRAWDFCVIHSNHKSDIEMTKNFIHLLETTLGIFGTSIRTIARGENTLQAASEMIRGSTKVFVLCTKYLENHSFAMFTFQSALMAELQKPIWMRKIIPLDLRGMRRRPFFLENIEGLTLGDDTKTVEIVSEDIIGLEEQMQVRAARSRAELSFRNMLGETRRQRLQEIQEVIARLREDYGDEYDPSNHLPENLQLIDSIVPELEEGRQGGQVITVSGSHGINIGPSYHFHGKRA